MAAARTCSGSCRIFSFRVFLSYTKFVNKVSSFSCWKLEAWTQGETHVGSSLFSSCSPQLLTIFLLYCLPCWPRTWPRTQRLHGACGCYAPMIA